jgi:hypothetical protein
VSGDHRLLESSELSGRKCPLTRLRERDAGEPGAALPTWVVRAGTPPSSQGVPGALVGKDRRCHELPLQDKRRGRIHLDRRGSPPRGAPALRRPRRPPLQREDRVNYRADDPESRENVGLEDLRFGVIGLGWPPRCSSGRRPHRSLSVHCLNPRYSRTIPGTKACGPGAWKRSICRRFLHPRCRRSTACHAEGRGFESHQPLSRIRLYRASNGVPCQRSPTSSRQASA